MQMRTLRAPEEADYRSKELLEINGIKTFCLGSMPVKNGKCSGIRLGLCLVDEIIQTKFLRRKMLNFSCPKRREQLFPLHLGSIMKVELIKN